MVIRVERYQASEKTRWDAFVSQSKNGTFLFYRAYMDYHNDRFTDHSLLIFQDEHLIALLPANLANNILYSHQGLTYGGFITDKSIRATTMLDVFTAVTQYARGLDIHAIYYKLIPHIYHRYPAEEDLYGLFRVNAHIEQINLTTAIKLPKRIPLHQSKKTGLKRAQKAGVTIQEMTDFPLFFSIVESRLAERYNAQPVHTPCEMQTLATAFPENIKLFGAFLGGELLAGTILYLTDCTIHTQYIGSTAKGRELRAVDFLISHLIDNIPTKETYFDFGISNEQKGKVLNAGLVAQKEEFGGRSIAHHIYVWPIAEGTVDGN